MISAAGMTIANQGHQPAFGGANVVDQPVQPERAETKEDGEEQTFGDLTRPACTGAARATFFDEQSRAREHGEVRDE